LNKSAYIITRPLFAVWLLGLMLMCSIGATAQKYAFAHYDIEDGLIQSQVNNFYQDDTHRLWIATLGGLCRFDGHEYYSISKANGLANNFVYTNYTDSKGTVWIGTQKGLSSYNNQKIYNYPVPADVKRTFVLFIAEDKAGNIWTVMDNHLYKSVKGQMQKVTMPDSLNKAVVCIATDNAGTLYASFVGKGVYKLESNKWQLFVPFDGALRQTVVFKMQFDRFNAKKIYLLTLGTLFSAEDGVITPIQNNIIDPKDGPLISFEQDYENNLWIGAQRGAYFIGKQKAVHFTAANGLTNSAVSAVYCDKDHNIWLGTQGSGMYRYEGGNHLVYSQLQGGNSSDVVMSITRDKQNNILLGTAGNGIMKYSNGTLSHLWAPQSGNGSAFIQSLFTDKDKNVWIGTDQLGIWKYNGSAYTLIKGTEHASINHMVADGNNTLWIATPLGVYYYGNSKITRLPGISSFTTVVYPLGRDSVLVGTQEGIRLVINKKLDTKFKLGALSTSSILCILSYRDNLLFGTDDGGLYLWNRHFGILKNYTEKDGFMANTIYSLVADDSGTVWVGTGRGINRITMKPGSLTFTIKQAGASKDLLVEANQNSVLYDGGKVFFGTTKGVVVFNAGKGTLAEKAPHVLIQNVKLFADGDKGIRVLSENPGNYLKLAAAQNHVVITFQGVYLKNPDGVTYQYKLSSLNDDFCPPVKSNIVDYPSLPPGKYTFEVKALSPGDKVASGVAKLKFEIAPHFYQEWLFRAAAILLLILSGFMLQRFVHKRQIRKKQAIEVLKREEKQKLRQQTAEDFHDDLGNKLTRITVLSDVLNTKLGNDKPDQKSLVEQIQQNAAALYNGTRDILWALDPKSDNLYEILVHIKETGIELFHDVNIDFSFEGISESYNQIKLPMEYSRNITMIFKELLTNVLKHAEARSVSISLLWPVKTILVIRLADDGKGYDENRSRRGHGLVNIKARARRIDGVFLIESSVEKGTVAELQVKINIKV
jgi:ligand-binding sensor domain-containing protein/signal transduction histidine kinase